MKSLIIHDTDMDGFGAAWAVRQAYPDQQFEYMPLEQSANVNMTFIDRISSEYSHVFIVDMALTENLCDILATRVKLTVMDHHVSNNWLANKSYGVFDNEHSACAIAWKFLKPDEDIPLVLQYIEDRDMWRFDLPDSKEINTYTQQFKPSFELIDKLYVAIEEEAPRQIIRNTGVFLINTVFRTQGEKLLNRLNRTQTVIAVTINSDNEKIVIPCANWDYQISECADYVLNNSETDCVALFRMEGNDVIISMRSKPNTVYCDKIAQLLGGGGHRCAAGAKVDGSFFFENLYFVKKT